MFYRRPSASWLDRLRSSKGIPVNNDLNLEQFLTQNPNPSDVISIPNQTPPNSIPTNQKEDGEKWFSNMSNVLAELFVMEGDSTPSPGFKRKSSRKQSNPKIFIPPQSITTVENDEEGGKEVVGIGVTAMSPSNSVVAVAVAEDKEQIDVSGYSRCDVMVIDTSSSVWKVEKLVMRKGNVWKVKERDSKSRGFLARKKKRKLKQFADDESEDEKKKKKKKKMMMKQIKKMKEKKKKKKMMLLINNRSTKADGGDECRALTLKEHAENGDVGANEETQQNPDQSSMKRCKYLSSPGKPAKKNRFCT